MPRHVLISNDDGIDAPGLWALVSACTTLDCEVTVVAPSENQSAVGGSLSVRKELRWVPIDDPPVVGTNAWHVNGSPASAVIVGLDGVLSETPDLLISGINQGANLGNDLTASGTVGAALQGYFRGITSIAFSYAADPRARAVNWATAESVASIVCREELEGRLPTPVLLNVNIPVVPFEELLGIVVARVAPQGYFELMVKGEPGEIGRRPFEAGAFTPSPGTDIWAVMNKYVSVSPLRVDFTDHQLLDTLGECLNANWGE